MAGSFVNFAKYGDPSYPSLPKWEPCTADDAVTMLFDRECAVKSHFDDALYAAYLPVAPNPFAPPKEDEEEKLFLH